MAVPGRGVSKYHAKLSGRRWERVRRVVLDAADWKCALCGKYAREVDHIRPLFKGGQPFALPNLQPLCRTHHIEKTALDNAKPIPGRAEWRQYVQSLMNSDRI